MTDSLFFLNQQITVTRHSAKAAENKVWRMRMCEQKLGGFDPGVQCVQKKAIISVITVTMQYIVIVCFTLVPVISN